MTPVSLSAPGVLYSCPVKRAGLARPRGQPLGFLVFVSGVQDEIAVQGAAQGVSIIWQGETYGKFIGISL